MTDRHRRVRPGRLHVLMLLGVASIGASAWQSRNDPPGDAMTYAVDPAWPRPLPAPKSGAGQTQQWVTGDVSGSCIDARDHLFVVTRGFQRGGITTTDGTQSIASPPVLEFDAAGVLANSWGDPALTESGGNAVMPNATHGCFVDFENNVWIGGNGDGVLQKWSRDGKLLMQIGEKGHCDGVDPPPPPPAGQNWFGRPNRVYPTCAEPGLNASRTQLNGVADVFIDPAPDPVTEQRGSIYIADGYGNNRIVVFDAKGNYLRQWGSAGSGPGQFSVYGGGHPHCVLISNDGLVYACDRENARIHVTDKMGQLKDTIRIDPPDQKTAIWRATDIDFTRDQAQTHMFVMDLGSGRVRILERKTGREVGGFGRSGPMAGEFRFAHTLAVDSKDSVYVAETAGGRRVQKFNRVR
jgi:DNA-binding beta-propeller fold protein YncE